MSYNEAFLYECSHIKNEQNYIIKNFNNPEKIYSTIIVFENNEIIFKCENYDIVFYAITHKKIEIINWYVKSGGILNKPVNKYYPEGGIKIDNYVDYALSIGNVEFLEWFKNYNYKFKYSEWGMFYASKNGHVQVLKWFKDSKYKLRYNIWFVIYAMNFIVLKFLIENINSKKVIKWSKNVYCSQKHKVKKLKLKIKNNYFKGYNKN